MITTALCLAAAAVGFRCGYFFGRSDRNSGSGEDWRRSFNHENTKRPSGPPPLTLRRSEPPELFIRMDEGRTQRGNGNGGPTTPKPEIIPRGQWPGGYQPRSYRPGANPPPREP